jgi:hypothetical protein
MLSGERQTVPQSVFSYGDAELAQWIRPSRKEPDENEYRPPDKGVSIFTGLLASII